MKSARFMHVGIAVFATLSVFAMTPSAHAALIAHWNFNDPTTQATLLAPSSGSGSIDASQFATVLNFSGSTVNAVGADPSGQALALDGGVSLVNNGKAIVFHVDTTGFSGIGMTFATRRTSTGFADPTDVPPTENQVQYWDPGDSMWHDAAPAAYSIPTADTTFVFRQFDLSSATAVNNNADAQIRIIFNGATSSSGNNRIDNVQFVDGAPGVLIGACCLSAGTCQMLTSSQCSSASGTYQGNSIYCTPSNPCATIPGACCTGGSCSSVLRATCLATPGNIFLGEGISCTGACPPDYSGLIINEIRTQQPASDDDEFFEIYNSSGSPRSLNGLTYIVIGDATDTPQPDNDGVIEAVVDLSGHTIPAGGYFLVAEDNDTFGAAADLIATLNFEDSDNATHLLVSGFYGTNGQDLDTDNLCVGAPGRIPEVTPWAAIVDRVALISESNDPSSTECTYGSNGVPPNTIGPDGAFVPAHMSRIPDGSTASDAWVFFNEFDPLQGNDTPGATNELATGACCTGFGCVDAISRIDCVDIYKPNGVWKGRDTVCGENDEICQGACCYCTDTDPWCEAWACTVTTVVDCEQNLGGTYQGDGVVCVGEGAVDCDTCYTIAEARALFAGTPIGVRICNVRISSKTSLVSAGSATMQIQDASGADGQSALTVFGTSTLIGDEFGSLQEGDLIDIQGTLQSFNGLLELAHSNVIRSLALVHDYNVTEVIPPAIPVPGSDFANGPMSNAENRESEIVRLECAVFVDPPAATFAGQTNYTVTDGSGFVTVRIATTALNLVGEDIPTGPCHITGIFSQSDGGADPDDANYQLLPRTISDINDTPVCGDTAACCLGGATCRDDLTEVLCTGLGGNFHDELPVCPDPTTPPCLTVDDVRINEIRVDQPGTDNDEYFELKGTPTTPLGSLAYIVIGDGGGASGTVESVRFLTGKQIPADGIFLATNATYTLGGTPDDQSSFLNFENDDNMTHMIVENFTGTNGMDLDTDDNGVLDSPEPWDRIVDSVAIVKMLNPDPMVDLNEYYYSATTVGPEGTVSPSHVAICPILGQWMIAGEDPLTGSDTPGTANLATCACSSCPGDINNDGLVNGRDIDPFIDALRFGPVHGCADINLDSVLDYGDVSGFANIVLDTPLCGGLGTPTGTRVVTYNILNYSGSTGRNSYFKRIANALQADVFIVQEIRGSSGANGFLNNVLNAADGPGGYAMADFNDGPDSDNALYYRTVKIDYTGDHAVLDTALRDIDRWKLSHDGQGVAGEFYVYSAHLKASTGQTNVDDRAAEAAIMRADADVLAGGSRFIYAGDFNLYNANVADLPDNPAETAWANLTAAGPGRGNDPIGQIGIWHANGTFSLYHTNNPHQDNPGSPQGAAVGGGMDDRFDFMLVSDNMLDPGSGLKVQTGTYKAYGNDGMHLNNDINDAPVIPQGQVMADSLHGASDHIPVVMDLTIVP